MTHKEKLFDQLELSPGDWGVRIQLIEMAVGEGDMPTARRLVRASPSDQPTPPEIQIRLHALLTGATQANATPSAQDPVVVPPEAPPEPSPEVNPVPESPTSSVEGGTVAKGLADLSASTQAVAEPGSGRSSSSNPFVELAGGLSALVESDEGAAVGARSSPRRKQPPAMERKAVLDKWENYEGGLELAPLDPGLRAEAPSMSSERYSSLTFALLVHLLVFILIGLVVVQVPQPEPPQLEVSVVHEIETEMVATRMTRPNPEIIPNAAASQAVDVLSSVSTSTFEVPDVEDANSMNALSVTAGIEPVGTGMSFLTDNAMVSDVKFFGLSGSGKKIVFVIDATPEMLVDEKGGMTAYDNVKNEVAIMLANLNRGTQFNILLYDRKRLISFRDQLVPGLPSNLRLAIDWLGPINRDYDELGLGPRYGDSLPVSEFEKSPIQAADVAHYTKAIQKAMEWQASSIFCITSGFENMNRSPTPEMLAKMAGSPTPGPPDAPSSAAWERARERTREWLEKENAARREKGLSPKVVPNFNQLVREITGASPPPRNRSNDELPPVTPEDVEDHIARVVMSRYKSEGIEEPSLHMVIFLGEEETIDQYEGHFRDLTQKNKGKLKILRGLAALQNVTGK